MTRPMVRRAECVLLLSALVALICFSRPMSGGIQSGLSLCGRVIIPTLFPFMILSDMLSACLSDVRFPAWVTRCFQVLFRVPAAGAFPFLLGALCGFPLGVKCITDLYERGDVRYAEAVRLLCFCNNTGPAFIIAGVGVALFGNITVGIYLYGLQLFTAVLCGILLARWPIHEGERSVTCRAKAMRDEGFMPALRRSIQGILSVCALVILFSGLCGILSGFVTDARLLAFVYSLLEVGGATGAAAALYATLPRTALVLVAVAISFGGCSVHLQSAVFVQQAGLPIARYLVAKVLHGALCAALVMILPLP